MSVQPSEAQQVARVKVPAGTTAGSAVLEAGLPSQGPQAIIVVRDADGELRDLAWAPESDVEVEAVPADTEAGRSVIRHSAAHVLAKAVQQLSWRPRRSGDAGAGAAGEEEQAAEGDELAIAGEDGSLRIYSFSNLDR